MTNILVTGANGQLGNELRAFEEKFSNFDFYFTDVSNLDITDVSQIVDYLKNQKIDYIINCAAYTAVDKAESDPGNASLINTKAVQNLVSAAEEFKIRMIHISTDYVFSGTNFLPYKEADTTGPSSVYGQTKLEGEREAMNSKADTIIIRTSWLYSSFGNNFVKSMIRLGNERPELGIVFDQIGTPTYARDLASVVMQIIEGVEKSEVVFETGIYHYSNEGIASWYDFAKEIFDIENIACNIKPIETKDYQLPAKRPAYSVMNKAKIKKTFNVEIPHWKESLKDCLRKIKKH